MKYPYSCETLDVLLCVFLLRIIFKTCLPGIPFYTAYFTIPTKDRMSILDILQGGKSRIYFFNEEAFAFLESFRLSNKKLFKMRDNALVKVLDEKQMQHLIN